MTSPVRQVSVIALAVGGSWSPRHPAHGRGVGGQQELPSWLARPTPSVVSPGHRRRDPAPRDPVARRHARRTAERSRTSSRSPGLDPPGAAGHQSSEYLSSRAPHRCAREPRRRARQGAGQGPLPSSGRSRTPPPRSSRRRWRSVSTLRRRASTSPSTPRRARSHPRSGHRRRPPVPDGADRRVTSAGRPGGQRAGDPRSRRRGQDGRRGCSLGQHHRPVALHAVAGLLDHDTSTAGRRRCSSAMSSSSTTGTGHPAPAGGVVERETASQRLSRRVWRSPRRTSAGGRSATPGAVGSLVGVVAGRRGRSDERERVGLNAMVRSRIASKLSNSSGPATNAMDRRGLLLVDPGRDVDEHEALGQLGMLRQGGQRGEPAERHADERGGVGRQLAMAAATSSAMACGR